MLVREAVSSDFSTWDGLETGWLLLGTVEGERVAVLHAIPAGPFALRGPRYFAFDTHYVLAEMRRLQAADARLVVLGAAHTHPPGLRSPSQWDLAGDARMVRRLAQRFGIFCIVAGDVRHWYVLRRGDRTFETIDVEAVDVPMGRPMACDRA